MRSDTRQNAEKFLSQYRAYIGKRRKVTLRGVGDRFFIVGGEGPLHHETLRHWMKKGWLRQVRRDATGLGIYECLGTEDKDTLIYD